MVAKPPTKRPLGCLFAIIGAFVGFWLAGWSFSIHVAKIRAADPKAFICGNEAIPGMLFGVVFGGLGGIVFGKVLGHFLDQSNPDA